MVGTETRELFSEKCGENPEYGMSIQLLFIFMIIKRVQFHVHISE